MIPLKRKSNSCSLTRPNFAWLPKAGYGEEIHWTTLQRQAHWCIFDVNLLPGAIVLNCGMDKNLKMRLSFGTTCFNIHRFVQGEMSVALQVNWRMQEMRVLLTTVLIFFRKIVGIEHLPLPLYRRPFWSQMYRVWPVDEFQNLVRGRGRFGRGLPPR